MTSGERRLFEAFVEMVNATDEDMEGAGMVSSRTHHQQMAEHVLLAWLVSIGQQADDLLRSLRWRRPNAAE